MATIFSRIIAGEIPSYKIAEDDRFFAFLDINPMAKGHTLVVPKQEIDYIFDLDDSLLAGMALFAKYIPEQYRIWTLLIIFKRHLLQAFIDVRMGRTGAAQA